MHDEGTPASPSLGALGHVLGQGRTISKYKSPPNDRRIYEIQNSTKTVVYFVELNPA